MRVVFRMSAIVAALAVATSAALAGCGQRGPLYLPTVPPLPEKPQLQTVPPASDTSAGAQAASATSDTAVQAPLTLAPAESLGAKPNNGKQPAPAPASSPASDQ